LLTALSLAYFLIVFLSPKEEARIEQRDKIEIARKECVHKIIDAVKLNLGSKAADHDNFYKVCMSSKEF